MENIKNFCIIAHIDHGKSTLADRFLEITGTIPQGKMRPQYLDMMDLEREKGITIKMQPVRMNYTLNTMPYTLNLIDTPGHVDFSYEVSRALACVEGAILLVDATQGIQAQTLANLDLARKQNLTIIPAVNKIDSPQAKTEQVIEELAGLLDLNQDQVLKISAKLGTGVEELLKRVIAQVQSPAGGLISGAPLRALIFDSKYDSFRGIIAYARIIDGEAKSGDKIYLIQAKAEGEIKEVGFFSPELKSAVVLKAGEIGYIATGIKEPGLVRVGDTITVLNTKYQIQNTESLPGYKEPKPMVFASIYPRNSGDFDSLKDSLNKLKLNDAALTFESESKEALGRGFRCGFLGTLHTEIVSERLRREFNLDLVISTPSVVYRILSQKNEEAFVYSPSDFPEPNQVKEIAEPWAKLEIISPLGYLGPISDLLKAIEAVFIKTDYLGKDKIRFYYETPLRKIIVGFYDKLKGVSSGFASMNYEVLSFRPADLVKIDILIAGKKEEVFSKIVERKKVFAEGKRIVQKLKEVLPPQLFAVSLQAASGSDIIARETISAKRRDVIAPLYGGDYTRKRKLLEKQKKGKKKLKGRANITIPQEVFLKMFTE